MKTRYGVSPWIDSFPDSRRPSFEQFRGDKTADIVIVGGGLTGCATAYAIAAAGLRPILLEASRIGQGSAGRSAGLLLGEPGTSFRDLVARHGLRTTRLMLEGWKKAASDGAALMRRLGIRCDAVPVDTITVADPDAARGLRKEFDSREAAGIESTWLDERKLTTATRLARASGLRARGGLVIDPYAACVGMARAAVKSKARLFEKSPVEKIVPGAKDVEVVLRGGRIRTGLVVIATGSASPLFKPLQRHLEPRERYAVLTEPVPAPVRKSLFPESLTLRFENASRMRVRWAREHRLLISGADQDVVAPAKRPQVLVQRTGQLMYELLMAYPAISGLRPEFGWESTYAETADGLIHAGPHRNYPRHLFALGGDGGSLTGSFLAARLLARAAAGEPDKTDQVFGWTR